MGSLGAATEAGGGKSEPERDRRVARGGRGIGGEHWDWGRDIGEAGGASQKLGAKGGPQVWSRALTGRRLESEATSAALPLSGMGHRVGWIWK